MSVISDLNALRLPNIFTFDGTQLDVSEKWSDRRRCLINTLLENEYGIMPAMPISVTNEPLLYISSAHHGKAKEYSVLLHVDTGNGIFNFEVSSLIPVSDNPIPFIIAFAPSSQLDEALPFSAYELTRRGWGVSVFSYTDVTADRDDQFTSGISSYYSRKKLNWGKISMWAWAASCVLDYVYSVFSIDAQSVAVIGHRLTGKAALLAGALDTRFKYIIADESGYGGAALGRILHGSDEKLSSQLPRFSYRFAKEFAKKAGHEDTLPFDQHFLLSAIAPRKLVIACPENSFISNAKAEYLACVAASEAYEYAGVKGLDISGDAIRSTDGFGYGNIAFVLRPGDSEMTAGDWRAYLDLIDNDRMKK